MLLGRREEIAICGRGGTKTVMRPQAEAVTVIRSGMKMILKHYKKRRMITYPIRKRG